MLRHAAVRSVFLCTLLALAACSPSPDARIAGGGVGGDGPPPPPTPEVDSTEPRTRYAFNNRCVVLQSVANNRFVTQTDGRFAATATALGNAEAFYFKPSALGDYLLFTRNRSLLAANTPVTANDLAAASNANIITVRVLNDRTSYAQPPLQDREPTPAEIAAYRDFKDPTPELSGRIFTLDAAATGQRLLVGADSVLTQSAAPAETATAEQFRLLTATGCATFPEANSNVTGETFKGETASGGILGMADVHVHLSATNFLANAQYGDPFHRFGVTHALADCKVDHGENGVLDLVGSLLGNDFDGHSTDGWPTFTDWPSRSSLTHEAIYWKWLERAWMSGLRIMVNDVVDNETLCELQRNVTQSPLRDCNEMNNAARQVGTLYAMQDYIDAQYGGRGKGWFRIVLSPAEARSVIADGKLALVIGIEISNVLDCKLKYNPLRQQEPFQETGTGATENAYTCSEDSVKEQLARLTGLGVRQIITIHEFDNAFGGNGIFDGLVLNAGNRENTGGIPSQDIAQLTGLITGGPSDISPLGYLQSAELPTGEFWTTYDCPEESPTFQYLWGNSGGAEMTSLHTTGLPEGLCPFIGQGGRPGGTLLCYPAKKQCNARWMTPMGLFAYKQIMEKGLIFDIDHLELEMKTQALELAEAQPIAYPFVSTHGTFGGTSNDQARRILKNQGFLYPSLGNGPGLIREMAELKAIWAQLPSPRPLFGFGFGTDTNGLSAQASPRGNVPANKAVKYPFQLFDGTIFDEITDFQNKTAVTFNQPEERNAAGEGRTWSLDEDGSAHYGMLSDFVQEMRLEGTPQDMTDLFNSAERYLQTWEQTLKARDAIVKDGGTARTPVGILRPAPKPANPLALPMP
ncbi:MAG: hypothetical protein V4688_06445 [Pseudomonadota bacterium]